MVPTGADTVAFLSSHGRYLCANDHGGLEWDRTAVGPWEQFHIAHVGPNHVTLRTAHNKVRVGVCVCVREVVSA